METHSNILFFFFPLQYSCLAGYSPWGCKESDMTERLTVLLHFLKLVNCVTLHTSIKFSLPQFPHLFNRDRNCPCLIESLGELYECVFIKCLVTGLACSKSLIVIIMLIQSSNIC